MHMGHGGSFVQVCGEGLCVPHRLQGESAREAFKPHEAAGAVGPLFHPGPSWWPLALGQVVS